MRSNKPRELRIALAGHYAFDDQERFLEELAELASLTDPAVVILDLSKLERLSAPCAAWLHAVLDRADLLGLLADHPNRNQFAGPSTQDDASSNAAHLRIVRRFSDATSVRALARDLSEALSARTEGVDETRLALRILLDELAENVTFHADAPFGGFVAVRHDRGSDEIEVGVVDLGIGIRASLMRNRELKAPASDRDAVQTALMPLVTATPQRNGGFGLAVARTLLTHNGGTLVLRSGDARIDTGRNDASSAFTWVPGTIVALRIRTDRPLDISATYTALEPYFDARFRQRGLHDDDPTG